MPVLLASRLHDQQVAIRQVDGHGLLAFVVSMAQLKVATGPKRQRGDRRVLIDLRFIVGVPPHSILPVPVQIQQTAVEFAAACTVHVLQQRLEPLRPA